MQSQLQVYAEHGLPQWPAPRVGPLTRITDGWESELYRFDLEHGLETRHRVGLVLRLYPGDGAAGKAQHEFTGMQRLHWAGYPVPAVHHLALEDSPLGKPFMLMERIEGEPLWPLLEHRSPAAQQALLTTFCELMVRLHRLDWRPFVADPPALESGGPYVCVDALLAEARSFLTHLELTGFMPVIDWLAEHRLKAACPRPAVVHRDFHPANVLVRADGSGVVIDWTGLAVSDARFDLAWTLVLAQAYAGPALRATLLAGYERANGAAIEHLDFFEVYACARRLADVVVSLTYGAARMGMRPEAVALMRQQWPAVRAVAGMLHARTGLRLEGVERLLAEG